MMDVPSPSKNRPDAQFSSLRGGIADEAIQLGEFQRKPWDGLLSYARNGGRGNGTRPPLHREKIRRSTE